jgi:iron complex outermembrane receptor protein
MKKGRVLMGARKLRFVTQCSVAALVAAFPTSSLWAQAPAQSQETPQPPLEAGEQPDGTEQGTSDEFSLTEDIVVTAQRREQAIQDVGISIAAYSGEQLTALGVESSVDVARITPGVSLAGSYGGQMLSFTIRGVTQYDYSDHTEAPNAVYIDEAYTASQQAQGFAVFDIERVEVLKGPQGTLFGRNATGGAISFTTRSPTTTPEGFLDLTYGSYDHVRVEGALGGPLSDAFSARVSVLFNRHDEILKNQFPGGDDEWNDHTLAGRLRLRYEPTDNLRADLSVFGGKSRFSTSPYQHVSTLNEYNAQGRLINSLTASPTETREAIGPGGINYDENHDGVASVRPLPGGDKFGYREADGSGNLVNKAFTDKNFNYVSTYGATGRIALDLGGAELVSVTDYKDNHKRLALMFDESPNNIFQAKTINHLWQFSQEVRIAGKSDQFRWLAGLYYLHVYSRTNPAGFSIVPIDLYFADFFNMTTDSVAAFGQVEYDITPTLTFIGGLRGVKEKKDFFFKTDILNPPPSLFEPLENSSFIANYRTYADKSSDFLWAARAQLNWKPNQDLLFYASYNRGVKAGSYNAPLGGGAGLVPDDVMDYGPEILHAFEAGFKTDWPSQRIRLNGSAYYYNYDGYQAFKITNLAQQVLNAQATVKGVDLELAATPVKGLNLSLSGSYVDMVVKDINYNSIIADRRNVFTPKLQFNALARYEWDMFGGSMAIQGDTAYKSHTYYSISNFDSTRIPGYWVHNARVSYTTADRRWELAASVQNIANERYRTVGFDLSADCGCSFVGYAKPRWYDVSVRYAF